MIGSIDPRCETVRGTHWPKKGRVVDWSSRRGSHLGQRFKPPHQQAGHMDASDPIRPQKLLAARGPSTYGSRLKAGTTRKIHSVPKSACCRQRLLLPLQQTYHKPPADD